MKTILNLLLADFVDSEGEYMEMFCNACQKIFHYTLFFKFCKMIIFICSELFVQLLVILIELPFAHTGERCLPLMREVLETHMQPFTHLWGGSRYESCSELVSVASPHNQFFCALLTDVHICLESLRLSVCCGGAAPLSTWGGTALWESSPLRD